MVTNEEAKRCPLCAEEMDFTDQQLKPCECGYQVCVWCWHQIMDMAEKDGTEGRCPACRTHYDKDKIVGMEANFERVVANANRKHKPTKAKSKTNEGKKDLSIVRVIQRKMAYVIGLPLTLADEDLLKRKEFFGQYGKICKISLSRTAGGALQQFVNDSCSVYITFSKEEEAVQCIQSVHGFVLEGRFLRASFGTAKYCHAWLRNVPCNNSMCLYLHSLGAEEDSFGKDEVAAVHTRSRVQQIVGATHNLHRRSGNVLPPPVDGPCNYNSASTEKPVLKSSVKDIPGDMETFSGHSTYSDSTKDKDECVLPPNKGTTFVDIIVRPSSSSREKDANVAEDRRGASICSELSAVELHKDNLLEATHSDAKLHAPEFASKNDLKGPSSESSDIWNLRRDEGSWGGACVSENFGTQLHSGEQTIYAPSNTVKEDILKESGSLSQEDPLLPPSYHINNPQYFSNHVRQHGPSGNASEYSANLNAVHKNNDEILGLTYANWNGDGYNENKFQSSAKSDMIYRSSKPFSNEEVVEHLRRLDDDERIRDAQRPQSPSLEAVEQSIISNIMSLGLDAIDEISTLHPTVSGLFNHTDMQHGSSLNLYNNDRSMFSFGNREGFVNQITGLESSFSDGGQDSLKFTLPQNLGERKDSYYLGKPEYLAASSAEVPAPPGYSLPSRAPPPGFSASEIIDQVLHANPGNTMVNANSFINNHYRTPSSGNSSNTSDVDLIDQTMMSLSRGHPPTGLSNSSFDTRPNYASQSSAVNDEARAWLLNLLMQQSTPKTQDMKYAQTYGQQAPAAHQVPTYFGQAGSGYSSWNDMYGASMTHTGQVQQSNTPSSYTLSQQKLENAMYSNNYQPPVDEMRLRNELGMVETKRDEKLGFNKFYTGYGSYVSQPSSDDRYTRVFGI